MGARNIVRLLSHALVAGENFDLGSGDALSLIPEVADQGSIEIGNGTKDMDVKIFLGSTTEYVLADVGNSRLEYQVDVKMGDAKNIILDTTTGTKIGTTVSQKLGFFNTTPVVQPAAAGQGSLTNSTGGTADGTIADVTASFDQAILNNNFTELHRLLDAVRTALVNLGLVKGAA